MDQSKSHIKIWSTHILLRVHRHADVIDVIDILEKIFGGGQIAAKVKLPTLK